MTTPIERILGDWSYRREHLTANFNEWAEKLRLNPTRELSWADARFDDAAELKFLQDYLPWLQGEINPDFEGDRIEQMLLELRRDLASMARNREASTSVTSNRMGDAKRVACAKMVEYLDRQVALGTR